MSKNPSDKPNNNGVPISGGETAGVTGRFIAALEADENAIDSMTADEQAVFRLGAAIRKSTHDDLPSASEKLREQLIGKLDHDSFSAAPKKPESKMSKRSFSPFALAACLLLALGLIAIMFALPPVQRVREARFSSKDQTEPSPEFFGQATTRFAYNQGQRRDGRSGGRGALGIGGGSGDVGGGGIGGDGDGFDRSNGEELSRESEILKAKIGVASDGVEINQAGEGGLRGGQDYSYQTRFPRRVPIVGDFAVEQQWAYESGSEEYDPITENKFIATEGNDALSTFSIDVDTASYANMRRFLLNGQRPPRNSIRIEELVNYFTYDYPQPTGEHPFAVDMELANCPWNEQHQLLRVALKGKDVHRNERSPSNLVFLLDVSGSMQSDDKLPLLKQGLTMMVQRLSENDSVSIVTYAGNAGVVLNPTSGSNKRQIEQAIEQLNAGGSTNGSAGIEVAYELAQKQFINEGSNRVILATDGDLNVGVTNDNALVKLIKDKASEGVFLTVLGFGTGNLKDSKLEKMADNGNGMYAYIDSVREAHKVLIEQMSGSLETIAKDVKIQIEFNPAEVAGYRLIGYENRVLAAEDFDNDRKDAGEIGAGHSVTALYEIVLKNASQPAATSSQPLKYQSPEAAEEESKINTDTGGEAHRGDLLTLALRYKQPDSSTSQRIEFTLANEPTSFSSASGEFRFAASVASFGMILRQSRYRGNTSLAWVEETASRALGHDTGGYRAEFLDLIRHASTAR